MPSRSLGALGLDPAGAGGPGRKLAPRVAIGPRLACTQAACPSAPFDREYVTALAGATSYLVAGNELTITSTGGVLGFARLD